jgi:hypothetical protein
MVLTKKKSFNLNNTSINRSRKINSFSQEGSGDRTSEQIALEKKVGEDTEYKQENRLNLFIGFNDYYKIDNAPYKKQLKSGEFYITKIGDYFYLKKFSETEADKYEIKFNDSPQELSNRLNKTTNPNILNVQLSLRQGGLPVCLVNQYRVYQMTTNDVQEMFLKKISRYLTDSSKTRFTGGFVNTSNTSKVINGGAESEESPLERHLNALTDVETYNADFEQRVKRIVDKLIEKMFSAIDKSYPEGEEENIASDLENEIDKIFTKYLDKFLKNVKQNVVNELVKNFITNEFRRDTLTIKLKARAGFQEKTGEVIRQEAEQKSLKENEKFHSEFLYQEGYTAPKNLFGNLYSISYNTIHFYVRKAFGYTESEIEKRHQSYMILVIYDSNIVSLIEKVIETFEFLRDSIYDEIPEDSTPKSKESIFYNIITKNFIRLRKRNYGEIGTGYVEKKNDIPVSAIEFYSASRNVPVSSIIEFIKMLIEYTLFKYTKLQEFPELQELPELQKFPKEGIKYQLINKKEVEAIIGDAALETEIAKKKEAVKK